MAANNRIRHKQKLQKAKRFCRTLKFFNLSQRVAEQNFIPKPSTQVVLQEREDRDER